MLFEPLVGESQPVARTRGADAQLGKRPLGAGAAQPQRDAQKREQAAQCVQTLVGEAREQVRPKAPSLAADQRAELVAVLARETGEVGVPREVRAVLVVAGVRDGQADRVQQRGPAEELPVGRTQPERPLDLVEELPRGRAGSAAW